MTGRIRERKCQRVICVGRRCISYASAKIVIVIAKEGIRVSKNVTILLRTPDRRSWNAALDKLVEEMGKADLYCGDTPYECCAGEKVGQVYGLIEALKVRSKK